MSNRRLPGCLLLLMGVIVLSDCSGMLRGYKHKPKSAGNYASMQAKPFVLNLALAELALNNDADSATPYVKALNRAGEQNTSPKTIELPVVVIDYTLTKKTKIKKLLVPVVISETQPKFSSLEKILQHFPASHVLHNLQAYTVIVALPPSFKFSKDNAVLLAEQLKEERDEIMASAEPLPAYDTARLQLQLTQFFLDNHLRDAAYLSMENAKDTLTSMARTEPDQNITALSQEAHAMESKLHKEMPFKL
jgi:hypothetical protein